MPLNAKLKSRLKLAGKSGQLILNFLKIDRVPEEFAELTSITEFSLRGNRLKELPPWVANCRALRKIDLAQNPIATLPEFLADLPELQELRLEDTKVRTLPASFERLGKIKQLFLPSGAALPSAPRLKAAVQAARKFQEELDRFQESMAAPAPAAEPEKKKPLAKVPWKRIGSIASVNASLSVLLGDAASAAAWDGPRRKIAKQLAKQKAVALDGVVVLDGSAGIGTADVLTIPGIVAAAVEPDWDWIAEEVEDPAAAGKAILAAIARRGKPVGRVEVPSGKLAMACGWSDLTEYAAPLQRLNPGAGSAKPLEEDGLVFGVRPGAYTIERTTVPIPGASMEACVIVLRRA